MAKPGAAEGSWNRASWDRLLRRIEEAYTSMDRPTRRFALQEVGESPHAELARQLSLSPYPVVDDTDVNTDVCFTYVIGSPEPLSVRLSMVGPYAILRRVAADDRPVPIDDRRQVRGGEEDRVWRLLAHHEVHVLSETQLYATVPLKLGGLPDVSVYEALFEPQDL